ncbi:MAG: 30S ribosomal protein S12 methylthiotransferase RimO [Actinomycetota bacterium]
MSEASTTTTSGDTYWLETLGCPKNEVDSAKLHGRLAADGMSPAESPDEADLVVVNTCAFIEGARQESIDVILELSDARRDGARLVVTGCLAERHGEELAEAMPEVDRVAGFGHDLTGSERLAVGRRIDHPELSLAPADEPVPDFDLLNLQRPASGLPWAYVKVAEGCDRKCGFCAIPSFRGTQRSRSRSSILSEVEALDTREIVLVAQDLARYGADLGDKGAIVPLVRDVSERVDWVRLLYLYPSELTDELIDTICSTGVPYFDLSLQHVSRPLVRRMRRWGEGSVFLERISTIRSREPDAALRSNFIVGYPGETEDDHQQLLDFVEEAQLDWCGFFPFSPEDGTYAVGLDDHVPQELMYERLGELSELQDRITMERRAALIGRDIEVLVDAPGVGRSFREAPEIDGVIAVPDSLEPGSFAAVRVTDMLGFDLEAEMVSSAVRS